jgi:hypothetical protein
MRQKMYKVTDTTLRAFLPKQPREDSNEDMENQGDETGGEHPLNVSTTEDIPETLNPKMAETKQSTAG